MARNRNSTALFELIKNAKKPPKSSPSGALSTSKSSWTKGGQPERPAGPTADRADRDEAGSPPEPSSGTRRSWLAAARRPAEPPPQAVDEPTDYDDEPADPAPPAAGAVVITKVYPPGTPDLPPADETVAGEADSASEPLEPRPPAAALTPEKPSWAALRDKVRADRARPSGPSDPTFDPTANVTPADLRSARPTKWSTPTLDEDVPPAVRTPRPRRSAGPTPSAAKADAEGDSIVALDRSAGEVRFRLSYGGAILAAVIVVLALVIAYLAGRTGGEATGDQSVAVGRSSTDGSGDTAVTPSDSTGMMAAVSTTAPAAAAPQPAATPVAPSVIRTQTPAPAPTVVDTTPAEPAARQPGQLYAVVQSYPDRETAHRAGDFLNRNGVACTVVPGLSGFALRDWYSVVALQPIRPRDAHTPAVRTYLRQLTTLGQQFSPSQVYNQFQPQVYTWQSDSDTPRP